MYKLWEDWKIEILDNRKLKRDIWNFHVSFEGILVTDYLKQCDTILYELIIAYDYPLTFGLYPFPLMLNGKLGLYFRSIVHITI